MSLPATAGARLRAAGRTRRAPAGGRALLRGLAWAGVVLAWLFSLLPVVWMLLSSLKAPGEVFSLPLLARPIEGWHWENYREVWHRLAVGRMLFNSLAVAVAVVAGQLVTSTVAGYVLARLSFRGRGLLFLLFVASLLVPDQLTWIPSFRILHGLGLIDTYGALILPFAAGGLATLVMWQQFLAVPRDLEEAARLDGCRTPQIFRHVLLPLVSPGLRVVAALVFLYSWNDLVWPLLMTHRAAIRTLPVGLALLQGEMGTEWHLLMAASVVATVPALLAVAWLGRGLGPLADALHVTTRHGRRSP